MSGLLALVLKHAHGVRYIQVEFRALINEPSQEEQVFTQLHRIRSMTLPDASSVYADLTHLRAYNCRTDAK